MTLSIEEAQEVVIQFCREFPAASRLQFKVRETEKEIYDEAKISENERKRFKAGYVQLSDAEVHRTGRTGRVFVSSSNADNRDDLVQSLRHEIFGHHGINQFSHQRKRAILQAISRSRQEQEIKKYWEAVDKDYASFPEHMKAEEVFCLFSESVNPEVKINKEQCRQALEQTCFDASRPMMRADLIMITQMVADNLCDKNLKIYFNPDEQMRFRSRQDPDTLQRKNMANLVTEVKTTTLPDEEERRKRVLSIEELPEEVKKRFQYSSKQAGMFYSKDTPPKLLLQDKGKNMTTLSNEPAVAEAMVEMAKAKGWNSIVVKGSTDYKREVWLAASLSGLQVKGYSPKPEDLARLETATRNRMTNTIEQEPTTDRMTNTVEQAPTEVKPVKEAMSSPNIQQQKSGVRSKTTDEQTDAIAIVVGEIARARGMTSETSVQKVKAMAKAYVEKLVENGVDLKKIRLYDRPKRGNGPVAVDSPSRDRDFPQPKPAAPSFKR